MKASRASARSWVYEEQEKGQCGWGTACMCVCVGGGRAGMAGSEIRRRGQLLRALQEEQGVGVLS